MDTLRNHHRAALIGLLAIVGYGLGLLGSRQASGQVTQHVAYFKSTPSTDELSPSALATEFASGGETYTEYTSWNDVLDAYATAPFDALLLDEGSIALATPSWVEEHSTFGLVVAGINVQESELGAVTNESRLDGTYNRTCAQNAPEVYSVLARGIKGTPSAMTAVAASPTDADEGDLTLDPVHWWWAASTKCTTDVGTADFYGTIREGMAQLDFDPF